MKLFLLIFLFKFFSCQVLIDRDLKSQSREWPRITGGELAKAGQFPHHVRLSLKGSEGIRYICGGSIIDRKWILTAAHCLKDKVKVKVFAGTINIDEKAIWSTTVGKSNMIIHEKYESDTKKNDIGLISLKQSIIQHPYISAIKLPSSSDDSEPLEGKELTTAGFGKHSDDSGVSQRLRYVTNKVVSNQICASTYGWGVIDDLKICLETDQGKSHCNGDSGGGVISEENGRKVVGIVSFGYSLSCTAGFPIVETKVSSYLDWIHEKTGIEIEKIIKIPRRNSR